MTTKDNLDNNYAFSKNCRSFFGMVWCWNN